MFTHYIHRGHSTNSSSSHSVIIDRNNKRLGNDYRYEGGFDFGWEWFRLETPKAKMRYYAAQLYSAFYDLVKQEENVFAIISRITDLPYEEFKHLLRDENSMFSSTDIYVDHQSNWNLPATFPDYFYRDLKEFLLRDDVVIIGGNDNDSISNMEEYYEAESANGADIEEIEELRKEYENIGINLNNFIKQDNHYFAFTNFGYHADYQMKKEGDTYVIFDRNTGNKERFTFSIDPQPYIKARVPELVDISVTDFCRRGCKYCYKNCSFEGKHADLDYVKMAVETLGRLGVFEIAMGGGEIFEWPYLDEFLMEIKKQKKHQSIPNINLTTYSSEWLENRELVELVKDTVSAIGVSVHGITDLDRYFEIKSALNLMHWQRNFSEQNTNSTIKSIIAQHVFESIPFDKFMKLMVTLKDLHIDFLLLGFKETGRGANFKKYRYTDEQIDEFAEFINDSWRITMSIDTALAKKQTRLLEKIKAWRKTYSTEEGKFSCYIDAVSKKMGPSSYCDPEEMMDLTDERVYGEFGRKFLQQFKKF